MHDLFAAFGVNWQLLIAQAVNFGIVLVALTYFLYKPVMGAIEKRRVLVAKGVEEAAEAHELLSHADADAASRVNQADLEAERIVANARTAASAEKARIADEAEARALAVAKDAEARAKETQERARRESERDIARLAILAAEKIMRTPS